MSVHSDFLLVFMIMLCSIVRTNSCCRSITESVSHSLRAQLHVTDIQLLSAFTLRWRCSTSGSDRGLVEGKEWQLLFTPHLGARLRQFIAMGECREECGGFVCGCAGSNASSCNGCRAAGPSAAWRFHCSVGGVQLQLKQQHPMV